MIYSQKLNESIHRSVEWNNATTLLVSLGLACFCSSLFLVSFFTSGQNIHGFWVMLIGWFGALIFQFAWFANPLNLLALLLLSKQPLMSLLLSLLALIFATQTFLFMEVPTGLNDKSIIIKELGLGFYIWYAAQFFFLLGILVELLNKIKSGQIKSETKSRFLFR